MRLTVHLGKAIASSPVLSGSINSHRINELIERFNFIVQYSLPAISIDIWEQLIKSLDPASTHGEAIAVLKVFGIEADPIEAIAIVEVVRFARESGRPLSECYQVFGIYDADPNKELRD